MATQKRSSLIPILEAVKARVVAVAEIPEERVVISLRKKVPHLQADQDVVLRPRGFKSPRELSEGGGRVLTGINRRLEVRVRTRFAADVKGSDENWLLDETNGHLQLEEAVIDALQEFYPTDAQTNDCLVRAPLLLMDGNDPEKDAEEEQGWGSSVLTFEFSYLLNLTLTA